MMRFAVKFNQSDDISAFVDAVNKIECDVDLVSGRMIVDAKSIMGVMAISKARNLELVVHANDEPEGLDKILNQVS